MKPTFLILFVALSFQIATSQNALELNYGLRHIQRQDLTFSPLIFKGIAPLNLGLTYQKSRKKSQTKVSLAVSGYAARSVAAFKYTKWDEEQPLTVPPSSFWNMDIVVGHLRKIGEGDQPLSCFAGLALDAQIGALFYEFGEYSAFGYTTVAALSPQIMGAWKINEKNSLQLSAKLPLLNWVARSPYAINDDEFIERQSNHRALKTLLRLSADGQVASLGTVQAGSFSAKCQRTLSSKWALSLSYDFSLLRSQNPQPLTAITQGLVVGIAKKW